MGVGSMVICFVIESTHPYSVVTTKLIGYNPGVENVVLILLLDEL